MRTRRSQTGEPFYRPEANWPEYTFPSQENSDTASGRVRFRRASAGLACKNFAFDRCLRSVGPLWRSRLHFLAKQIAPPKEWAQFEDLCLALFKEVWKDPLAQKNGRKGQAQRGVDVYGSKGGDPRALWGVQCKGKDANYGGKPTRTELEAELTKAEGFKPTLAGWVFATTAPTDGALQEAAREISLERAKAEVSLSPCLGGRRSKRFLRRRRR